MVVTSPFPRRTRSRPMLAAQSVQQVWREVRSEDELIQALTPTNVTDIASLIANTGRRIVIAAPITLKRPIVIPATLPGTTIESHGYLPIFCSVDGMDGFIVQASLVTLRGLLIASPAVDGTSGGPSYDRAVRIIDGADFCRVIDVHGFGVDCLVEGEAGTNGCLVRGCTIGAGGNGTDRYGVIYNGTRWRIQGNELSGAGAGAAVVSGTSGARASIVGNSCDGTGITTSAGLGSNTISANTDAGTVTAHGTGDTIGGNT